MSHPLNSLVVSRNQWLSLLSKILFFLDLVYLIKTITENLWAGNTKGGSITVTLTSCLTGLESAV
jgi:uncharacterized membrane-anchored protein